MKKSTHENEKRHDKTSRSNLIKGIKKVPVLSQTSKLIHSYSALWKKVLIGFYLILFLGTIYHIYFARRIIPGVRIGSVSVGGKTYVQARTTLEKFENATDKSLKLNYNGNAFYITSDDIGLRYNWDASIIRAFEVGRTGNLLNDSKDKAAGLVKSLFIPAFYDYEEELYAKKVSSIEGEVNSIFHNAGVAFQEDKLVIVPEQAGKKIDTGALFKLTVNSLDRISFEEKTLPVVESNPEIRSADIEQVLPEVQKIVQNDLKIKKEGSTWTLTKEQKIDILGIEKKSGRVTLELNEPKFEAYLDNLAQDVDELPKGLVAKTEGNKVEEFEVIENGRELDEEAFTEDFKDAFFTGKPEVELAMRDMAGNITKETYGIVSLLGEGESKYTGSAAARANNLNLAAQRTSGVLVPPGEVYSFNQNVGEISGKTGYDTAYIIQGGKTVLGEGGGVCQTSTTLFRAVLNAGLPVVTRYPHAYRVYYYELDRPVGFDAAIFQPSLDFQFRNDTENYILVQTEPDKANQILRFKLYGTPDGREVEISEPKVTNVTPPPEAEYIDDPNLPKGTVKQIDFAAWGAHVTFSRTVKNDNEVLFEDSFSSRYQPWKAVYLRGTKE